MKDFTGVKLALFYKGKLLVYQRDDKKDLRWANLWDFPGGGRENNETPFQCARREVIEEFGFTLIEKQIAWQRIFPAMHDPVQDAYFMVGELTDKNISQIQFGSEGQRWDLMTSEDFLKSDAVIPKLKVRLAAYLNEPKAKVI